MEQDGAYSRGDDWIVAGRDIVDSQNQICEALHRGCLWRDEQRLDKKMLLQLPLMKRQYLDNSHGRIL